MRRSKKGKENVIRILGGISLFVLLLLTLSLLWTIGLYGHIGFEEVIFVLKMPLKGASNDLVQDYIRNAFFPSIGIFLVCMLVIYFPFRYKFKMRVTGSQGKGVTISLLPLKFPKVIWGVFGLVWFVALLMKADDTLSLREYLLSQIQQSYLIEQEYVKPAEVELIFPEKKRNLICIFMESAETTNQDYANGGLFDTNYTPEMTRIAKENVSFSQSRLLEGAAPAPGCTWTVAGMLAETSGVPFKLPGGDNNTMYKYEYFLPGLVSLGDILEQEGYYNCFFAGSDFTFGARRNYFTQHGNYEIFDYPWAKSTGKIPADYRVWWGYEDAKLYEFAKEKILELSQGDTPFNVSLLTVDTHQPGGYQCQLCPDKYEKHYANAWACASAQINEFVEWAKQQDFYEDTTIFICGDHCSMDTGFYSVDMDDEYPGQVKRKVYNAFVNAAVEPVQEKERRFTTMDMFPSILASMGVKIEGERLGLGTNLFSDERTLAEKMGFEELYKELNKKSAFYYSEILYPKNTKR